MIRFLCLIALLATLTAAIDHEVFKNCSRIPFCTILRNNVPTNDQVLEAKVTEMTIVNDTVIVPLVSSGGQQLILQIVSIAEGITRVTISEPNSTRFELLVGQALHAEPKKTKIQTLFRDQNKAILRSVGDVEYNVEILRGPPFSVNFGIDGDNILSVLKGDRLIMESGDNQTFTFSWEFEADKLYGLFDHAWKLALDDTEGMDPFRMRNSDSWGYEANSPMALYGAHPVIYGHNANYTSGIFLHNAAEQWIDISYKSERPSAYFMVESALLDIFVLAGPTPKDVVRQITGLTGKPHMPQLWTLGYHQCRFSYRSQEDVKTVANLMVANRFPMDAIWIDGDHTDDYRWFHWNHTTYTDPVEMQQNISALNKVCVTISDPHIAVDDQYDVYVGGKGKYFVRWDNGSEFQADCWPGLSSWIDFFLPEAADYYGSWYSYEKFNGSTPTLAGIWNDMNEPAIFADPLEKTLPFEAVHRLDNAGRTVRHRDVHNIYGLLHAQATHKGLLKRDNNRKRPFILSRSHFMGTQRVAAIWTGDNNATWEHFSNSLSECMTGNLVGLVFCGADIGGFIGNPTEELLQRWYQGAVWTPFFRGHSSRESDRREPYLFSNEVQDVLRAAIELRYKHIPYIYTLFYIHTVTGDPIISPLFYRYPGIQERDSQILVGKDIMAVAVVNSSVSQVEVVFPGQDDIWYRIDDQWKTYNGGNTAQIAVDIKTSPVFYRGGGIIPRKDAVVRLSTFDAIDDPYTLYITLDKNNRSSGLFYYDDFDSFDYINENAHVLWNITYSSDTESVNFKQISGIMKNINISFTQFVVHYLSPGKDEHEVVERTYNQTRDGRLLKSINFADKSLFGEKGQHVLYL